MCPWFWQLGAGAPITVRQFAPLAQLRPGARFLRLNKRVFWVQVQRCVLANQSQQA
jgi:hypothetical protein